MPIRSNHEPDYRSAVSPTVMLLDVVLLLPWKRLTSIHEHREFVHFQRQLENRRRNRVSRVQTNLSVNTCQSGWTMHGTGFRHCRTVNLKHGAREVTQQELRNFKRTSYSSKNKKNKHVALLVMTISWQHCIRPGSG